MKISFGAWGGDAHVRGRCAGAQVAGAASSGAVYDETIMLDFSALKNTELTERVKLRFRAEFFNILNHANFGTPNPVVFTSASVVPAPMAGVITSTSTTSRQIQFGLKLLF